MNEQTAPVPQVRKWWIGAVFGLAFALGAWGFTRSEWFAQQKQLQPLKGFIGEVGEWASLLAGLGLCFGMFVILVMEFFLLRRWVHSIRVFDSEIDSPPESWPERALSHCYNNMPTHFTMDDVRRTLDAREKEYQSSLSNGWLLKYYIVVFLAPGAGLLISLMNSRRAGSTPFLIGELLWPVFATTLVAGVILAVALLMVRSGRSAITQWKDAAITRANQEIYQRERYVVSPPPPIPTTQSQPMTGREKSSPAPKSVTSGVSSHTAAWVEPLPPPPAQTPRGVMATSFDIPFDVPTPQQQQPPPRTPPPPPPVRSEDRKPKDEPPPQPTEEDLL